MARKKKSTLIGLFRYYNRKYFNNKLKVSDARFGRCRYSGETSFFDNCDPVITINRSLLKFGRYVRMVLLHEMAHVELSYDVGHGPKFIRRMQRLVKQGAFDNLL